jgi:hypothetical protein
MKGVKMKPSSRLLWNVLSVLVLLLLSATALTAQKFEIPPTLPAQTLVPASLLSGDGFRVRRQVPTDGLMAHFTIESDVGIFPANSIEMLEVRVAEILSCTQLSTPARFLNYRTLARVPSYLQSNTAYTRGIETPRERDAVVAALKEANGKVFGPGGGAAFAQYEAHDTVLAYFVSRRQPRERAVVGTIYTP